MRSRQFVHFVFVVVLMVWVCSIAEAQNLALNTSGSGFPTPLGSDNGWGGGTNKWEIVDGARGYTDMWAHGLAFTGGHVTANGGGPWVEPAGIRQATIDFGKPTTFDTVMIWHHGVEYTAQAPWLDYWNGSAWVRITLASHSYPAGHVDGEGYSHAELFTFEAVTGSKVRYSMDNSQYNVLGTFNIHGWINEFEVYDVGSDYSLSFVDYVSPPAATVGEPGFTLTINGANFSSGAVVRWNGMALATTFISSNVLAAAVPSSMIAAAGTAEIDVNNPGGTSLNAVTLVITSRSNLSVNASGTDYPSPLESDNGWGGGSNKWEIVDGFRGYVDDWAHGLAFTGGHTSTNGDGFWVEPAGVRQATIDFGKPSTFDTVMIWHHGVAYTAQAPWLDYWNGTAWVRIVLTMHAYPAGHVDGLGYSDAELFRFAPVTGSKVRYSMDNSSFNVLGTYNVHGWINEFDVYGPADAGAPEVSLSKAALDFGNQNIGVASAQSLITLSNTGTGALTDIGITVTGTNASDFAQSNTCGVSVPAGATCTVKVTFTPSAEGRRSATLSIADNATGSPQTVDLSGSGVEGPKTSLSPTTLSFGNQNIGVASGSQGVTLSNTGTAALTGIGITVTGANASDFAQSNTCGVSVAVGATCTVKVIFTPSAVGSRTAALSITDNATGSPQTVTLSGSGFCTYLVALGENLFDALGGSGAIKVGAAGACPWTAVSNVPWITVSSGSGSGNGSAKYTVGRNPGGSRTGTIRLAGRVVTITQKASTSGAVNVTQKVTITKTGFKRIPNANWVTGTISVKNSSAPIPGPIYMVLKGIPRGSGKDAVDIIHSGAIPVTHYFSTVGDYIFPLTPGQFNTGQILTLSPSIILPSYMASPSYQTFILSGAPNK